MFFRFWENHGVLGINARNLHYLKLNTRDAVKLADDKLKTKQFLSVRGVTVPKTLGKILNRQELAGFNFSALPQTFVLKPVHGYGGEGILVLEREEGKFKALGKQEFYTEEDLRMHILDILDGKFSVSGFYDEAFFEQRLVLDSALQFLVPAGGLPDVRIIYYNLVPTMAMLRLPTRSSAGKANVHLGGVGLGIDLSTGKTTYGTQYNKFIDEIPEVGSVSGIEIPGFDEMLLMGSKIQQAVGMGYLAVDIVPDENNGPTLLEMNARAGLMVQVANRAPLRTRLLKLRGLKISSPEKAVQIGKDLFAEKVVRSQKKKVDYIEKTVVGFEEEVELILPHGTKKVLAQICPQDEKTYLDEKIIQNLAQAREGTEEEGEKMVKFMLKDSRHKTIPVPFVPEGEFRMKIGSKNLTGVLIDPSKNEERKIPVAEVKPKEPKVSNKDKLLKMDRELFEVQKEIKLLGVLKPKNLEEEKKRFFEEDGYEPQFLYKALKIKPEELRKKLNDVVIDLAVPGAQLFLQIKKEIAAKLSLIEARGLEDFTERSKELYGEVDKASLALAKDELASLEDLVGEEVVGSNEAVKFFEERLLQLKLQGWVVRESNTAMVSRCTVSSNKKELLIRKGTMFSKVDLEKLLLHEVYTHVLTAENGGLQPYKFLQIGTADYLRTQEGLAIYNQTHFGKLIQREALWKTLLGYYAVALAQKKGFRAVFDLLMKKKGVTEDVAWDLCVKVKRGLKDTSRPGGFTRQCLYFDGYLQVVDFVKQGGDLHRLYVGKFGLKDLEVVEKLPGLSAPKFIPPFLD